MKPLTEVHCFGVFFKGKPFLKESQKKIKSKEIHQESELRLTDSQLSEVDKFLLPLQISPF